MKLSGFFLPLRYEESPVIEVSLAGIAGDESCRLDNGSFLNIYSASDSEAHNREIGKIGLDSDQAQILYRSS